MKKIIFLLLCILEFIGFINKLNIKSKMTVARNFLNKINNDLDIQDLKML